MDGGKTVYSHFFKAGILPLFLSGGIMNQILKEINTLSIHIFNLHLMTQMRFTISQMQNITENTKLKYLPFG